MLLSMTGFGDARKQDAHLSVAVEVRAVNNRYLKVSIKCPDSYAPLEGDIEKTVRESISRGTVSVSVRVDRLGAEQQYVLNREVLQSYWRQLNQIAETIHLATPPNVGSLLQLPGVVIEDDRSHRDPEGDWPLVRETLAEAMQKLHGFRAAEGGSMEQELRANARTIAEQLERVAALAPQVVTEYRDKLYERVRELVESAGVSLERSDLIREVSIFSERCDVNEEIARLRSHLEQFDAFLKQETSSGRKLEFLSQEMFREVNTIGSKANNVTIAHAVVEMKAAVEKMRELLQNVE